MPIYGRYEVVERLNDSPSLTVSRARLVDGRHPLFLVRVYHPPGLAPDELRLQSQTFTDRVKLQQQLGARPDSHWAPVRHLGTLPTGAFYVTDHYPASLQSLIAQRTPLGQHALLAIVSGIVDGLAQLQNAFRRSHGNLTAGNVLLDQKRPADARVLLSDPASAMDAKAAGVGADLHALGEIIHELVLGRPFDVGTPWPVPDAPQWNALGPAGRHWQKLCSDLLSPRPAPGASTVSEVQAALEAIDAMQRRSLWRRMPRPMRSALAACVVAALAGGAGICWLDYSARNQLADARRDWLGGLATALADPSRARRYQADPGLRVLLADVDATHLSTIDPHPRFRSIKPWLYRQTREQLSAVDRVRDDLTPAHWQKLADALAMADRFNERGWTTAAASLKSIVADVKPGPNLDASIDRALTTDSNLRRDVPTYETNWNALTAQRRELRETGDRFLDAAGAMYESKAASAINLTDAGLAGLPAIAEQSSNLQQLVSIVREGLAEKYDLKKVASELEAPVDLAHVTPAEVASWRAHLPDYVIRRDAIASAVADLTLRLQQKAHLVAAGSASAETKLALSDSLTRLDVKLKAFEKTQFIARDLSDGTFAQRRKKLETDIDALGNLGSSAVAIAPATAPTTQGAVASASTSPSTRSVAQAPPPATSSVAPATRTFASADSGTSSGTGSTPIAPPVKPTTSPVVIRPAPQPATIPALADATPAGWIKALPQMTGSSDVIAAYWEDWKHVLQNSSGEMSTEPGLFASMKSQTSRLYEALLDLDKTFPLAPAHLPPSFTAAALERRDREINMVLAHIDPKKPRAALPDARQAAEAFAVWEQKLAALSADFPLRAQIVRIGQRPDLKWAKGDPAFWSEPTISNLVSKDVERINCVAELAKLSRSDLADAAASSTVVDVTVAAWEMLGSGDLSPAWPTRSGELEAERDLRQKVAGMIKPLPSGDEQNAINTMLNAQGPMRWARFVEAANSEQMLAMANDLRSGFGDPARLIATLTPQARFNMTLYQARQQNTMDDSAARQLTASLNQSAAAIADRETVATLAQRLATLDTPERFADRSPPDRYALSVSGAEGGVVFQRVQPVAVHPFYLGTVDVSVGQFINVVSAAGAWDKMSHFRWAAEPGKRDARRGPRVWEWIERPALTMSVPLLWLAPDDDNDYLPTYRITRFNRTALSDDVGGNPLPDHPMQQIPAEAALYYAAICQSRLPTSSEWREAYAIFERTVPMERWNLRDQTWDAQRKYVATITATTQRWPDEAIFRPVGSTAPSGAEATARPERDGALFFRSVNGPGGGTFRHLVGNVAQFVCDEPEAFDNWPDKQSVEGIRKFIAAYPSALRVIGGSAMSPPELPFDKPLPLPRADHGYSDVGFRLAFTAPSRSLAERLRWALAGQKYLWEKPEAAATTAPSEAVAR